MAFTHIRWLILFLGLTPQAVLAGNDALFPPPLPGWTAGKIETGGYSFPEFSRGATRYYDDSQGNSISINIEARDCKGAELIKKVSDHPEALDSLPAGSRPLRFKGYLGLEKPHEYWGGRYISILIRNCLLVTVGGKNPPRGTIKAYLERLDFEKIKEFESETYDLIVNPPELPEL